MFRNQQKSSRTGGRSVERRTFEDFEIDIGSWEEPQQATGERVQGFFQVNEKIDSIITFYPNEERVVIALQHATNDADSLRRIASNVERTVLLGSGDLDWEVDDSGAVVEYVGEGNCTRWL